MNALRRAEEAAQADIRSALRRRRFEWVADFATRTLHEMTRADFGENPFRHLDPRRKRVVVIGLDCAASSRACAAVSEGSRHFESDQPQHRPEKDRDRHPVVFAWRFAPFLPQSAFAGTLVDFDA
jgi:hypothetical protein